MPAPAANYTLPQTSIVAESPAPIVGAPAPVVECIQAAPTFQLAPVTVTVTGVDMNRDGTPVVLLHHQVGYSAPVQYGTPVDSAPTFHTVTAQSAYQYGIPQEVQYTVAPTIIKKKRGACC